jgi:hypothetical protein
MKAHQEVTEVYPEKMKENPEEMKSVAEHQEVSKEEAAIGTIGALEDRYGKQHLPVEHQRQLKKWTQGDGGSWKKLAASRRRMTCRGIPALCKGRSHKEPTVKKRQQKGPECNNGIRN